MLNFNEKYKLIEAISFFFVFMFFVLNEQYTRSLQILNEMFNVGQMMFTSLYRTNGVQYK